MHNKFLLINTETTTDSSYLYGCKRKGKLDPAEHFLNMDEVWTIHSLLQTFFFNSLLHQRFWTLSCKRIDCKSETHLFQVSLCLAEQETSLPTHHCPLPLTFVKTIWEYMKSLFREIKKQVSFSLDICLTVSLIFILKSPDRFVLFLADFWKYVNHAENLPVWR